MLTKSLKDKDTFYYVKRCFHGDDKITFDVLAYEFHPGDEMRESSMYDINKMFNTKAEAEICAKILTTQHYCGKSNKTFGFIAHNISAEETLNVLNYIESYTSLKYVFETEQADYIVSYGTYATFLTALNQYPDKIFIPIWKDNKCKLHEDLYNYFLNIHNLDYLPVVEIENNAKCVNNITIYNVNFTQPVIVDIYSKYDKPIIENHEIVGLTITPKIEHACNTYRYSFRTNIPHDKFKHLNSLDGKLKIVLKSEHAFLYFDNSITKLINKGEEFTIEIDDRKTVKVVEFFKNFNCKNCNQMKTQNFFNR